MPRTMQERFEAAKLHQKMMANNRHNKKEKIKLFDTNETMWKGSKKYLEKRIELLSDQWGACGICRKDLNNNVKFIHLDHCHETGQLRGVLCHKCNIGLGMFMDNIEALENAIEYVKYFRKRLPWWINLPDEVELD